MGGHQKPVKPMGAPVPLPRIVNEALRPIAKPAHVCEYCGRYAPTAGTCDGCGAPVIRRRVPPKPTPPPLTREQADPNARAELIGLVLLLLGGWVFQWLMR